MSIIRGKFLGRGRVEGYGMVDVWADPTDTSVLIITDNDDRTYRVARARVTFLRGRK